jgi:hypothetical protein
MTLALDKAIAGLYEAFSCEPKQLLIPWCSCGNCAPRQNVSVLLSKSLMALTADDLSFYAESVFLTVGSESDFRYFLPRILEIMAVQSDWWPGPEVIGRAISDGWKSLSETQQTSVLSFFHEIVISLVESQNGSDLDAWICGIARCVTDLQPYLCIIEGKPSALIAFYEHNSETVNKGKLANSFWDGKSTRAFSI